MKILFEDIFDIFSCFYFFFKQQELLLDMFEDEYRQTQVNPIRIEYLLKDSCMIFPPTTTPLSGVEFIKRLPSGDIERARRVSLQMSSLLLL